MPMIPVLIPAYQPDEKLIELVDSCRKQGLNHIVVVNDGSARDKDAVFARLREMGCLVAEHDVNRGKGAALKTGLRIVKKEFPDAEGIVTADADGQHKPEDIFRVSRALEKGGAVLGIRDFSQKNVPFRSLFGNRISTLVFRLITGVHCPDTQTGLRCFSSELIPMLTECEGDRYEYEMNVLTQLCDRKIPIKYETISTVYLDENASSHFHPLRDSLRIYRRPLRFAATSFGCSAVDITLFTLFHFLFQKHPLNILLSTAAARCISGTINFTVNRKWSFSSTGNAKKQLPRYLVLFFSQMLASYSLVQLLSLLPLPAFLWKIPVDACLFFASYSIQRRWVYRKEEGV